jgi:hypothetical protein
MSRERGDALLSALDHGRQIQELQANNDVGLICLLPVPSHEWLKITLTNGRFYRIALGDGFVDLPEGRYEVKEAALDKVAKIMTQLDEDLRHAIVNAPKPFVYAVGTVDDGGTLSGIARLFYGDSAKWRQIYEANRKIAKNPNIILHGMMLTIPKLQ